jgi:asparagine synthetase B (glutamine-hydrolysing)
VSQRSLPRDSPTPGASLSPYSTQLTELEVACGLIVGEDLDAPPLPEVDPSVTPLALLERVMVPFLERPPCLVAFSGGRDSSVVLAVAAAVARREGLELPVPITLRFPASADSDESDWQDLIVRRLQLPEWQREPILDELDFVGPIAAAHLRSHGVLWPPNAHFYAPMLRAARGGTLLTGFDGDSVFRTWRWSRAASVLAGRVRRRPRDVLRVALALAPRPVRAERLKRQENLDLHWLQPGPLQRISRAFFAEAAQEPFRWDRRIAWLARRRYLSVASRTYALIAEREESAIAHPLLDRTFLAGLAERGGARGFGDVTSTLRAHFRSVLPDALLARSDKAGFDDAYWGPHSRRFVEAAAGRRIPVACVEPRSLRETWLRRTPPIASSAALQAFWLSTHRDGPAAPASA